MLINLTETEKNNQTKTKQTKENKTKQTTKQLSHRNSYLILQVQKHRPTITLARRVIHTSKADFCTVIWL